MTLSSAEGVLLPAVRAAPPRVACLQPRERDRTEGSWCAYHPVCGAITVLLPQQQLARAAGAGSKVTLVAPKQDVACVKP